MPIPPGGLIPSGIGGCLQVGALGTDLSSPAPIDHADQGILDVATWSLQEMFITAECTHSGTYGAVTRRRVAYDFRFSVSIPYDYENPPDELLAGAQSIALRLNLGDVRQDPLLNQQLDASQQRFYVAPSAFLETAQPVLDARGDVIRIQCSGVGNSLIFLFPDDQSSYSNYLSYLRSRGWLT